METQRRPQERVWICEQHVSVLIATDKELMPWQPKIKSVVQMLSLLYSPVGLIRLPKRISQNID
jgi:hypothetical protein